MSVTTQAIIERPAAPDEVERTELGDQRVLLRNISWETYEKLMDEITDQPSLRIAYYEGDLEIMTVSYAHEFYNRSISDLIRVISLEIEIDVINAGSTTLKRKRAKSGAEPDTCFYVDKEELMRGKTEVDLKVDPPPDIVFEVDLSSGSLDKFPIYGKFGVPELWRYIAGQIRIHRLEGRKYIECERSRSFPWLTEAMLTDFLEQCKMQGQSAAIRAFRNWLRKERPHLQD